MWGLPRLTARNDGVFRLPEIFISMCHYEDRNAVCGNPLNVSVIQNKEFQFK